MADIKLNQGCSACKGTGIRYYNASPGGPLIQENPCLECGGDGRATAPFSIEAEWFDDITDKLADIKEKVDEIMDKLNE